MRSRVFIIALWLVVACVLTFGNEEAIQVDQNLGAVGNTDIPTTSAVNAEEETLKVKENGRAKAFRVEELRAMSIKNLREFLSRRSLECKGCSEKDDYVKMAYENQHLPDRGKIKEIPKEKTEEEAKMDQAQIDELMAKLKTSGFGNSKFFNANDLKGMSPEEMAAKINGKSPPGSKKNKDDKKKSSSSKKDKSSSKSKSSSSSKKKSSSESSSKKSEKKPSSGGRMNLPVEEEDTRDTIEL